MAIHLKKLTMRIHLYDGPIKTTPEMLQFVHLHINASIGRFADRIDEVRVRLIDENSPSKGPRSRRGDKVCVMIATMCSGEAIMAREVGADFYTLIAAAANTLKRRLSKVRSRFKTQRVGDRATIAEAPRAAPLSRKNRRQ